MKNTTQKLLALPLLAFAFLPVLSNAQDLNVGVKANVNVGGMMRGGDNNRGGWDGNRGPQQMGSTTRDWNHSSSTRPMNGKGSANVIGTITAINGSTITLTSANRNATTTTVVTVDANTTYRSGTSTIALTNLAVGQRVSASGPTASSSAGAMIATRVNIVPAMLNNGNRDNNNGQNQSFISKCINWLKKLF